MYKLLPIFHTISKLSMLFSTFFALPALISFIYQDGLFKTYIISATTGLSISFIVWLATIRFERELKPRDGFTLVVLLWLGFVVTASLPFYLHFPNITFTDAFFESISGLTTTGATVLSGLDNLEPSLNFWRHFLNWVGGMGMIVLAVAILPLLGVGGMQLYKAEMPGLHKDNKLAPRITETAKHLWTIYIALTILCILLLKLTGISWLDSICHAMSGISLGGFSTKDASVADFDSIWVEMVLSFAMLLGAVNFATHFFAFRNKNLWVYWQDEEARTALCILFSCIFLASVYLWGQGFYPNLSDSFRYVTFNYISIATACGFTNADYSKWPLIASLGMFVLANFIANSGSTGGGIKMMRAIVLFKYSLREITLLLHPRAVKTVKINNRPIPERIAFSVLAFAFVYGATIVIFTFILMVSKLDFLSALSAIIACVTNVGPGLGAVGPAENYALLTTFQKWTCATAMLMGRLEIFTVLILFTPAYWRK